MGVGFLTKKSNPHLRQLIGFETGGGQGEIKNNYRVFSEYRELVQAALQYMEPETNEEFMETGLE